jgi:hypothetical protein
MNEVIPQGTRRAVDGQWRVYYDRYWIKAYEVPVDTLLAKRRLIQALTHRLFNHVEHGINIPGIRLEEARQAHAREMDPRKQRVLAAMVAGALFNRACDVFTKVVEIQALGVEIRPDDDLMRQCGEYLKEALTLGRQVLHRSGEEGIDELWGEPFKAFAYPIDEFYKSRYLKIALAMGGIDTVARTLAEALAGDRAFDGIAPLIDTFAATARRKAETLHTDVDIFEVWASFVSAGEELAAFVPAAGATAEEGMSLVRAAREVIFSVTRARVPMPKTTKAFCDRCLAYRAKVGGNALRSVAASPSAAQLG